MKTVINNKRFSEASSAAENYIRDFGGFDEARKFVESYERASNSAEYCNLVIDLINLIEAKVNGMIH